MTQEILKRGHGNWVEGDRFWDREADIQGFSELLDEGANILLVAPRRIGKTSLLHEAGRRLVGRFTYLFVDLQKCHSAEELAAEIGLATREHGSTWAKTKEVFKSALSGISDRLEEVKIDEISIKLRDGVATDWQPRATRLLEELAKLTPPVVICLDELPILVNRILKGYDFTITPERIAAADALVSWLRAMSIRHRGKLRMVLCGSIGLEPVLRQGGLSGAITTFTAFHLDPWDGPTAVGCIQALSNGCGIQLADDVAREMVRRLGCAIPHHVQLFFDLVYEDCRRSGTKAPTITDIDRVYRTRMLSSRGHAELSQLEERLMRVLGKRKMPLAIDLLTEAAVNGCLSPAASTALAEDHAGDSADSRELQVDVLSILEHDGYLTRGPDGYQFLSSLIRDWWKARFEFGYQPAKSRRRV